MEWNPIVAALHPSKPIVTWPGMSFRWKLIMVYRKLASRLRQLA